MRRLIGGFGSLFVAACGHPIPVGAGGASGAGGTGGQEQDASPPPPPCVSVAGRYVTGGGGQVVDVEQTNCDVSAVVPGFGSFTCVAQAPGTMPRLASCILHVDACPLSPDYRTAPADDGSTFRFSVTTRWSACHGNSMGGTLVFGLTLAPALPEPTEPVSVTFAGLTTDRAPVSTYVENGVTITTASADWMAASTFGSPAPSLQFSSPAGEATEGEVRITAGGPFSFSSIDLHSSTVPLPLVVEGMLGSRMVVQIRQTLDTTGRFFTFQSSRPNDAIDTLVIRMSNNSAPCCPNPMSIDNIVIRRPTE